MNALTIIVLSVTSTYLFDFPFLVFVLSLCLFLGATSIAVSLIFQKFDTVYGFFAKVGDDFLWMSAIMMSSVILKNIF